ncbi:hypothetical protein NDU88_002679 [Pleurodeles waltl]|uniref:ribonuclease H n=1 Tax=Pleurodeles waltl TaxID=8319 RepID=A0AAV7SED0_PLEWA|nr:hypothetical protein NDU88_002679 [Pleurodeles waltl]
MEGALNRVRSHQVTDPRMLYSPCADAGSTELVDQGDGAFCPGPWMIGLDLQDAYFHIPALPPYRRYLEFVVGHKHFQFTVLPFGLTSAPRVFTKVMVVVAAYLRRLGVPVFAYLEDWLLKVDTP